MEKEYDWRLLVPVPVGKLPADLAVVLTLVVLTLSAVFLPGVRETPLRLVVGLPFVLFIPGYASVSALFPAVDEAGSSSGGRFLAGQKRSITVLNRVALSFGASIAVVSLLGLVLDLTPWDLRLGSVVASIGGFTVACVAVAAYRRWQLPETERFVTPFRQWYRTARAEMFAPETRIDAALNVLLVLSIVLALSGVGYAIMGPQGDERITQFYVLTEDDGELVAGNYPTEFERGERKPVVLGIDNQEYETGDYTVLVELHRVETGPTNDTTVLEREELGRLQTQLAHNETLLETYWIEPTMSGEDLRLTFLLYKDGAPEEPTVDNAYRELHLWIDVTTPEG